MTPLTTTTMAMAIGSRIARNYDCPLFREQAGQPPFDAEGGEAICIRWPCTAMNSYSCQVGSFGALDAVFAEDDVRRSAVVIPHGTGAGQVLDLARSALAIRAVADAVHDRRARRFDLDTAAPAARGQTHVGLHLPANTFDGLCWAVLAR